MSTTTNATSSEQRFLEALRPVQASAERYAVSLAGDRDEAKDLLQEAIIIVWKRFEEILDPGAFKSYFFTVITNLHRRRYRRSKRFTQIEDVHTEHLADTHTLPDTAADTRIIREAIDKLSPKAREAILLYEVEDLSVSDIAEIQRSSVSAVKVRLMRARQKLKSMLNVDADDETSPSSLSPLL